MSRKSVRLDIINSIKHDLMGPSEKDENIERIPIQQYLTGIIYPEIIDSKGPLDEKDDRFDKEDEEEEIHTESHLPRSIGMSMIVVPSKFSDKGIEIRISGAIYAEISKNSWIRKPISSENDYLTVGYEDSGIKFSDKKETGSIMIKDVSNIPDKDKYLDGFEIIWETLPVVHLQESEDEEKWYLSAFIVNKRKSKANERASNSLYQTYLNISTVDSWAIIARDKEFKGIDTDLQSLTLLYHKEHEFAVGHQVSVNWDSNNISDIFIKDLNDTEKKQKRKSILPNDNIKGELKDNCQMVETTFFPQQIRRDLDWTLKDISLNMYDLSDEQLFNVGTTNKDENILTLRKLADSYKEWIENTFSKKEEEKFSNRIETFQRHKNDCKTSLSRIIEGIDLLEEDEEIYKAFCLMNRAMWLNWINKSQSKKKEWPYVVDLSDKTGSWRPFQMAFILQSLPSIANQKHEHRDYLDLLWVPTGGGKTEAYLGLVAFLLFLSRIRKEVGDNDGVEVIMRYTLRLLTIQQFQRASRMILACEYIRKVDQYDELIDCKPFSIGLYVGQNTTPNKITTGKRLQGYSDDYHLFEKLYKPDRKKYKDLEFCGHTAEYALIFWEQKEDHPLKSTENPVQILNCPWCGQELTYKNYHLNRDNRKITINCSYDRCPFSRTDLPLNIRTVDQTILDNPPSFLIGTVDKFAQLTFKPRIGRLFGWHQGKRVGKPPSLIIQDELHLINGPLGSMVGLYEASIDFLSTTEIKANGIENTTIDYINPNDMNVVWESRPKIIASTATIRNAERQCQNLYDRIAKKFPSPGTHISDSFFVKEKKDDENNKTYVGIFCSGIGMKTTKKRTVSNTLIRVADHQINGTDWRFFDPYWTIVSYFNSKRELGGAVTLMRDDVRTNVESKRQSIKSEESIGELHGGLNSTELPSVLFRLDRRAIDKNPSPYDVILCTNMFSVGIDVDRLGLMMMNCQPKATTEYLQSTGRVGRKGDGLVFVLFNQARPRDQSHFESFYDYHNRIQYHVEAMTVTPFSDGSIDRALHAQYVILMRQTFPQGNLNPIWDNTDCLNYTNDHKNHESSLISSLYLIQRAYNIERSEKVWKSTLSSLLNFQEEWIRRCNLSLDDPTVKDRDGNLQSKLLYIQKGKHYHNNWPRLLEQDPASPWFDPAKRLDFNFLYPPILTPNSLRNVEEEIKLIYLRRK